MNEEGGRCSPGEMKEGDRGEGVNEEREREEGIGKGIRGRILDKMNERGGTYEGGRGFIFL